MRFLSRYSVFSGLASNPVSIMLTTSRMSTCGRSFCFMRRVMSLRYASKESGAKDVPNIAL